MTSELVQLRDDIRNCTNCSLHTKATCPVPWSGPTPSKYLFIGMAPGIQEDKEDRPFCGASGNLLRYLLREAKFPKDIAYCNAVSCFPGRVKGGDAKPTVDQLVACRPLLQRQIDIVKPQYLFLVGGTALEAFRPDLSLSYVHGRPMFYDGFETGHKMSHVRYGLPVWTIYHPAAALRNKKYERLIREDLDTFWRWVRAGKPHPDTCYVCGKDMTTVDAWGFVTCELHSYKQGLLPLG